MKKAIIKELENMDKRSAWSKGVHTYAVELIEELENIEEVCNLNLLKKALLNGASDWAEYSWGGCSLIYNEDIAERLCTPSELKRTRNGERRPNAREQWLDVQARALYQACNRIAKAWARLSFEPCEVYNA